MLTDMKEQQAQSDREWEQATLDCENAIREQKSLRHLNEQVQTQIVTL